MSIDNSLNKNPSFKIETDFLQSGYEFIAGIDEAGRGALAGPLSVALVIFPKEYFKMPTPFLDEVVDSKKINFKKRIQLYEVVKEKSLFCEYIHIPSNIVDEMNVNSATEFAIKKLFKRVQNSCDYLLLDGTFKFDLPIKYSSIKKGDSISKSIAAASICAKVTRDLYMIKIAEQYPEYHFEKHFGYGTASHRETIRNNGGTPIHRVTYNPLKNMLKENEN